VRSASTPSGQEIRRLNSYLLNNNLIKVLGLLLWLFLSHVIEQVHVATQINNEEAVKPVQVRFLVNPELRKKIGDL
jgi:hypothetical protein